MSNPPAYELVDTPAGFARAAEALAAGRGPFAVDTERASAFRYDDRAFLVQINRRDAGTFLIAPEGHREAVRDALAPVINKQTWIIHAAGEDLASLALLGLRPAAIFDTELAARFVGLERSNLASVVERATGVHLEKGHGRENWSRTPLPEPWLVYAADDVAYLHDAAEALTEALDVRGLLAFAEAEFAHTLATRTAPAEKTWRDLKGISTLRTPRSLQLARELYAIRDRRALAADKAPGTVLPNHVLVDIARAAPRTSDQLARIEGFPSSARARQRWLGYIERALDDDPSMWPAVPRRNPRKPPSRSKWERNHPESFSVLNAARDGVANTARALGIPPENLLAPSVLQQVVWDVSRAGTFTDVPDTHGTVERLLSEGARQWQAEIAAPAIAAALAGS